MLFETSFNREGAQRVFTKAREVPRSGSSIVANGTNQFYKFPVGDQQATG